MPGETPLDADVNATYGAYLDRLADLGLAYTHVMEGLIRESREWPDGIDVADLHRRAPGAYMANNELDPEAAADLIAAGEADLVSFGRAYIANPDLVTRIATGAPLAEAPEEYWYGGDQTGYSDWPTAAGEPATRS
jgi:N-ethylmaleimide reductase